MNFKLWNRWTGWVVFAIAALTYLLTMEPVASLWDCSEFIATSYKLEVGHPPGAPLFMLMARIASIFAISPDYVPHMVNGMNCIASAFCILFLFWSITHIARRIASRDGKQLDTTAHIAVLASGVVGALAYTFTDTFWFSAVEGEVYALSSMFTALVVWLMLRWEEQADEPGSNRWIVLIAYLMGLSIGVHILNLLTIPALVFIYYFRKYQLQGNKELLGLAISAVVSLIILGIINGIIIPYTVYLGALVDVFFVNTLGAPVNSGIIFYALALFAALFAALYITHRRAKPVANFIILCFTVILIGFSSYATVTIRAAANPPMNSNNPDNPHALLAMLNRDQYGNRPLIYGPQFTAPIADIIEEDVYSYNPETKRYDITKRLEDYKYSSKSMQFFPRMWHSGKADQYKVWGSYRTKEVIKRDKSGNPVRDANGAIVRETVSDFGEEVLNPLFDNTIPADEQSQPRTIVEPTTMENLYYFFNYQLNYMYWRYFMWNFVGRQDDIQAGVETTVHGNWLSGIDAIDAPRLGPQTNLPSDMENNPGRNTYFFLPLLLGLLGLFYQLIRDGRYFIVVMSLFVMMGIALVVYFNTCPSEPRERDYVYAGSFYAFSIWIGLGVIAMWHLLTKLFEGKYTRATAAVAIVLSLSVPSVLAYQNWDDHDRSGRTYAHDVGYNYLLSTPENAIIINYGDNDTFPLWYVQEVEGIRTDVRIMNSSYLSGDWYIDEMKTKANEAAGVPFSLPRNKYAGSTNDQLYIIPPHYWGGEDVAWNLKDAMDFVRDEDPNTKWDFGSYEQPQLLDFLPTNHFILPVNKENVIAAGIVKAEDADLMLDEIEFTINKSYLLKNEMMILDLLATFDWTRPLCFTQVYILNDLGLIDYLQFDGYAYRLVPIKTKYYSSWNIGRIDTDYVYPLLMEEFRYGNLADEDVLVDHFTTYNLSASKAREAFARLATQLIIEGDLERAYKALQRGLEVFPTNKIHYSDANTTPFIEAYYMLSDAAAVSTAESSIDLSDSATQGDKLLLAYAEHLMEYLTYYSQFDDEHFALVAGEVGDYKNSLDNLLYNVAIKYNRTSLIDTLSKMFIDMGYQKTELDYLIAESYYYYGIYNSKGDQIAIETINREVEAIEEYFKTDSTLVTPALEQRTVDAMYVLEDFYSLSKRYSRSDIVAFLTDYLKSIGYNDEALSEL